MNRYRKTLTSLWHDRPLLLIMWVAALLRLISVIFARGWGMLDDHFLVIEVAQSWLDGGNKSEWLPWYPGNEGPTGHSFFYAGLHYLFFGFLKWLRITDPQVKMLLVRLLHAAWSMVIVYLGYRIAEKISGKQAARIAGLLLAAFWFMPWISVRNLVEVASVPFLIIATWMLMREESRKGAWYVLLAGLIAGMAFSVRYQTVIYAGGMGIALLLNKKIKESLLFGTGYLLAVVLLQGDIDFFVWGKPFAEFAEYVRYNMANRYGYITGEWYKYLITLLGLLIPPVSIFLFAGLFKNWRRRLLLFLPVMLFLIFHSYFPNKQERFILTIVPPLIILGAAGWTEIRQQSAFWHKHLKWIRGSWIFFWIINLVMLTAVSTMYSKRARAEAMYYLGRYDDVGAILLENTNGHGVEIVPQFYLGQWINIRAYHNGTSKEELNEILTQPGLVPRFVLFYQDKNLEQRVDTLRKKMPGLVYETTIQPGFMDKLLHRINPHNKNQVITIYRNSRLIPEKAGS